MSEQVRETPEERVEQVAHRRSRRSFLAAGAATLAGWGAWRWLSTRREDDGAPWPLRRALETNEQFGRDYFSPHRLARTYPRGRAKAPRVDGRIGLEDDVDATRWKLHVGGLDTAGDDGSLALALDDIRALPRVEQVTEFMCIEGWSEVIQWAGCRLSDFAARYRPQEGADYVGLATPEGAYYVGLDMASALHPQTLLAYEMNGAPLTSEHGAPLRLVVPVKYGVKSIKRVGTIRFAHERPRDYWAEQGYDWYVGL